MTKLALFLAATAISGAAMPAFAQDTTAPAGTAATTPTDPTQTVPSASDPTQVAPATDPSMAAPAPAADQGTAAPAPTDTSYASQSGTATGDVVNPIFTGPRIEAFGGADFQKFKYGNRPAGAPDDHTGGIAGVLGGFDIGLNSGFLNGFVVGVFGSYALPTSNGCANFTAASRGGCVRPEREIEAGGRIGTNYKGFLIYAKGAYVNTSTKVQSRQPVGTYNNYYKLTDGWRVGGGAEFALNRYAYVKVEYDYTRPNSFSLAPYGYPNSSYRATKNQALAGFGVRF